MLCGFGCPYMGLILMTSRNPINGLKAKSYILVTAVSDITLTHILLCETTADMAASFVACSDIMMTSQGLTRLTSRTRSAHSQSKQRPSVAIKQLETE